MQFFGDNNIESPIQTLRSKGESVTVDPVVKEKFRGSQHRDVAPNALIIAISCHSVRYTSRRTTSFVRAAQKCLVVALSVTKSWTRGGEKGGSGVPRRGSIIPTRDYASLSSSTAASLKLLPGRAWVSPASRWQTMCLSIRTCACTSTYRARLRLLSRLPTRTLFFAVFYARLSPLCPVSTSVL